MILQSSEPKLRDWSGGVRVFRKLGIFIIILRRDFFTRSDLSGSRFSFATDKIGASIEEGLVFMQILVISTCQN
jgi:hypothetical protein